MDAGVYDHVVIGAGIQGSSSAYYLAKEGKRTLLIDQFPVSESRGSSQGFSRIIRRAYAEDYFANLMDDAYDEWNKIQEESHIDGLLLKTGLLVVENPSFQYLDEFISTLEKNNYEHEVLDGQSARERFPSLHFDDSYRAVYDPCSGVLRADRCLRAIQKLFTSLGGIIEDNCRVESIIPGDDVVTVKAEGGRQFFARSLIICPGPWATVLLPKLDLHLPLEANHIGVFYWSETEEDAYSPSNFPNVMYHPRNGLEIFGLPSVDYPGKAKVCCTYFQEFDPSLKTPVEFEPILQVLRPFIKAHFPKLDTEPSIKSECFYTNTPDEAFILDRHPKYKNIVIGAGFSGTGFKMGPVVGKILCSLALNRTPAYDITAFRIDRFACNN